LLTVFPFPEDKNSFYGADYLVYGNAHDAHEDNFHKNYVAFKIVAYV